MLAPLSRTEVTWPSASASRPRPAPIRRSRPRRRAPHSTDRPTVQAWPTTRRLRGGEVPRRRRGCRRGRRHGRSPAASISLWANTSSPSRTAQHPGVAADQGLGGGRGGGAAPAPPGAAPVASDRGEADSRPLSSANVLTSMTRPTVPLRDHRAATQRQRLLLRHRAGTAAPRCKIGRKRCGRSDPAPSHHRRLANGGNAAAPRR